MQKPRPQERAGSLLAADRDEAPLKRLAADGVKTRVIDEIAAECLIVMLLLPGGKEVEQI